MQSILTWKDVIGQEKKQCYFKKIFSYITKAREQGKVILPPQKDIFNVFRYTALNEVKVVILGQDPYHGLNQAHGLSFSVRPGIHRPPSLNNIYKELAKDIPDFQYPNHGYLLSWAQQGVFLLNTILTVEQGIARSHANLGWEIFTDRVISSINQYCTGVIFLLWGSYAQKKAKFINNQKHFVLNAPHPSPISAYHGFFGCRHFSKTNEILIKQGMSGINWTPIIR